MRSTGYFILKAGSLSASVSTMVGKPNSRSENQTVFLATKWGELAGCILCMRSRYGLGQAGKGAPHGNEITCFGADA